PHATYITMHTFLPTMLSIVANVDGIVVGLRGDGAIACIGMVDSSPEREGEELTNQKAARAVAKACQCGGAMVKAIDRGVNRVLREAGVEGGLQMGVGIDAGGFVATNIGLGNARDLTAYGDCVNAACKLSSVDNNSVMLTHYAKGIFPTKKG